MMLLLHIGVALSSILFTGFLFISPSQIKINTSYVLVAATLITGTILVLFSGTHLVEACFSGLLYLVIISISLVAARKRLASQALQSQQH